MEIVVRATVAVWFHLIVCLLLVKLVDAENDDQKKQGLCFPVIGDIGGLPKFPFQTTAQKKVAKLLAEVVEKNKCKFIVGVGDNFYFNGVRNVQDPRFNWTFERTYSAPSLDIPWYMIAGNHDHILNVSAQIAYTKVSKRWNFPDFYYTKVFEVPKTKKTLQVVMLDTTMLCWHNKRSNSPAPSEQWKWIEHTLKNSKSEYLVVAGHHPMYSSGNHGNTRCLLQQLKPLFEKYSVTAYFSGHDHNLQHIKEEGSSVHYFISGSGNFVDQRFTNRHKLPTGSLRFEYATNSGFELVRVTADELTLEAFTVVDRYNKVDNNNNVSLYNVIIQPRDMTKITPDQEDINFMSINNPVVNPVINPMIINNSKDNTSKPVKFSSPGEHKAVEKSQKPDKTYDKEKPAAKKNPTFDTFQMIKVKDKLTRKKNSDEIIENDVRHQDKSDSPTQLTDKSKITIDNLSDIPLSSYSNLPSFSDENKDIKHFNKTGNKLKDFILQRLPANKMNEKHPEKKKKVIKPDAQGGNKANTTTTSYNGAATAGLSARFYFNPSTFSYQNYVPLASNNVYFGYPTPLSYQQAYTSYGYNSYYYWNSNRFPTISRNIRDASSYLNPPAANFQSLGKLTAISSPKMTLPATVIDNKKKKRNTVIEEKDKLSNFFDIQKEGK